MKNATKFLALAAKIAGMVVGLGAYANMLPEKWAPVGVIVFGVASILKDAVNRVGDLLDDGAVNGSFKAE